MMKLVYYPSFFRLKKYGTNTALVGATLLVFAGTWLLHSYQWFWLRGGFPIEPQDGLFWGLLGALVVIGALREMKRSRPRKLGTAPAGWSFSLAWRTVATFCVICILWSLWSAESLTIWLLMWGAAANTSAGELAVLAALFIVGFAVAGRPWQNHDDAGKATAEPRFSWSKLAPLLGLLALLVLSERAWYAWAAPQLASTVAALQRSTLNARDAALQHKGYYENLDNQSRMSAQLWGVTSQKPAHWVPLGPAGAYNVRDDFLRGELRPNVSIIFNDQPLTTNTWGMRDRERTLAKPPGVYRIAVLGPSHVMGSGVADDETFVHFLEQRLNGTEPVAGGRQVEVLNFGVGAYALTQQLAALQEHVLRFEPDAVIFTDSANLAQPMIQHLLHTIAFGQASKFERLNQVIQDSGAAALGRPGVTVPFDVGRSAVEWLGLKTRMPWVEADLRLRRSADRLVRATLDEMTDIVRRNGAVPVFLAMNTVSDPPARPVPVVQHAAAAGMLVFDLFDLWRGRDFDALRIAAWDNHPNAAGYRLIADRLAELIRQHSQALRLATASGRTGQTAAGSTVR